MAPIAVTLNDSEGHFTTTTTGPLALFPGLLGWASTRMMNHSGLYWSRDDRVAAASAGPYASNLHLTPDRYPRQHCITQFLHAGCSFCHPTNSVKALRVTLAVWNLSNSNFWEIYHLLTTICVHKSESMWPLISSLYWNWKTSQGHGQALHYVSGSISEMAQDRCTVMTSH